LETEYQFTAVDQVVSPAEFLLTSQTHLQWWSIRTCPVRVRLTFPKRSNCKGVGRRSSNKISIIQIQDDI